jgi:DNA polymerase-3 subunit delta
VSEQQLLQPAYLLTGTDRPKIETAVQRLRGHFERDAVVAVAATDVTGDDVVALCNAGSLFGSRRLVLVDRVDGLRRDDGRRSSGWKAADTAAVEAYLGAPAPDLVLALVAEELGAKSAFARAVAAVGDVLEYTVPKRGLTTWVADRLAQLGVRADAEACAALVALVGDDPVALANEMEKIAAWAAGEPVGQRDVEALVAPTRQTPMFALTDAWGARNAERLLEAADEILARSDRAPREDVARIAGALGGHVGRVRQLKRLAATGVRPREAATQLRMHPFHAEKVGRQAEAFGETELEDVVVRLADLDLALKGQSRLAPELELQRALVDLVADHARAVSG